MTAIPRYIRRLDDARISKVGALPCNCVNREYHSISLDNRLSRMRSLPSRDPHPGHTNDDMTISHQCVKDRSDVLQCSKYYTTLEHRIIHMNRAVYHPQCRC